MKTIAIALATFVTVLLAGCEQQSARNGWGKLHVEVPCGQALLNVTWKDDELWMHTRPLKDGEVPETTYFKAKSVMGIFEGEVTLKESLCK